MGLICSDQLLASTIHNNFKSRNKITENSTILLILLSFYIEFFFGTTLYFSRVGAKSLECLVIGASTLTRQGWQRNTRVSHQCLGSFWAYIVGQDPSDSKSSRSHVDINDPGDFWGHNRLRSQCLQVQLVTC